MSVIFKRYSYDTEMLETFFDYHPAKSCIILHGGLYSLETFIARNASE